MSKGKSKHNGGLRWDRGQRSWCLVSSDTSRFWCKNEQGWVFAEKDKFSELQKAVSDTTLTMYNLTVEAQGVPKPLSSVWFLCPWPWLPLKSARVPGRSFLVHFYPNSFFSSSHSDHLQSHCSQIAFSPSSPFLVLSEIWSFPVSIFFPGVLGLAV